VIKAPRILIVINADWYFCAHWLPLAKALQAKGCEVVVAATLERGERDTIEAEGFEFIPIHIRRRLTAPWWELASLWELFRLYRKKHPDLVFHMTIKPVIYGSVAARLAGVSSVLNAIPGLGRIFLGSGARGRVLRWAALWAYRIALSARRVRVIFENPDDQKTFVSLGLVTQERTILIRSRGVNIDQFSPSLEPDGIPVVLLASRLLWDKGVGELVEASRQLRSMGVNCRIVLVGIPDPENPNSVPTHTLEGWRADGIIEWWGLRNDMPAVLEMATIVVLPSYYPEGVPRILLEAAASGRPIVTADAPGCREIVRNGENGLLVPTRDSEALAEAIGLLLRDPALRARMGIQGRKIAVTEFSEQQVIGDTLAVCQELLGDRWPQEDCARL